MRLLSALAGGQRKSFTEPPFWANSMPNGQWSPPDRERIGNNFQAYAADALKASGVVFAVMASRAFLFSQARFQWREYRNGRPGNLFGSTELALLERPWRTGTTGELLTRMDWDASLGGNSYITTVDAQGRIGRSASGDVRLRRMRPDRMQIILGSRSGSPYDVDAHPIGFLYTPPAWKGVSEPLLLLPSEVCHYSPHPDPEAEYRGMSWLTPVLREIESDKAASKHKLKFFESGSTIQTMVTLPKEVAPAQFEEFVLKFKAQHEGVDSAYKTLFLGGGADLTLVGSNMQQMDFKNVQGAGETRVAAAAGIHPVIVGLSEGLQGSSLNAGNFDAACRLTADKTLRALWNIAASSLETLVTAPTTGARLTYDDRDIPFLRDDEIDVAAIQSQEAATIAGLVTAGYESASVIDAIATHDWSRLVHTGMFSVQLQAPGTTAPAPTPTP